MLLQIRDFYSGQSVFITGATGFIGKALIEKLLRSCNGIERIYILMRDKKGKSAEQRWNDYISDDIFKLNNINISEISHKLVRISGDISLPNLGISNEDRQQLIDNVTVVLHVASYVKMDPPLREAIHHNVLGTIAVVQLCRQMKKLEVLVYVSTITLLLHREERNEKVFPTPVSPEHVIESCKILNDQQLKKYAKLFFSNFPNTYIISKALAEQIIEREKEYYNIAIVRPTATNPAYREPAPGWVYGISGPSAVVLSAGLGIMRVVDFDCKIRPGHIPVDFVCNAILASAWFMATNGSKNLQVYHLTTQSTNTPSVTEMIEMIRYNSLNLPSMGIIRAAEVLFLTDGLRFKIESFFRHWVFAYMYDLIAKLTGAKTGLVKMTDIMMENVRVVKFFVKKTEDFEIENTRYLFSKMPLLDQMEFDFEVSGIDWQMYYKNIWMGLRRYLLKEGDEEIPEARIRLRRVIFRHNILVSLLYLFLASVLSFLFLTIC